VQPDAAAAAAAAPAGAGGAAEPKREKELGKFSGKKSKAVAKGGAAGMSQYEILLKSGLAEDEIPAFADPHHWLGYFPPLGQEDLTSFGLHADWRRSFITTVRACVRVVCVWRHVRLRSSAHPLERAAFQERRKAQTIACSTAFGAAGQVPVAPPPSALIDSPTRARPSTAPPLP
jgi:hypothetical protein